MRNEDKKWMLTDAKGVDSGPFTYSQLRQQYAAHQINGDTLSMPKSIFGASGWKPLSSYFPDFKGSADWPLEEAPSERVIPSTEAGEAASKVQGPGQPSKRSGGGSFVGGVILIAIGGYFLIQWNNLNSSFRPKPPSSMIFLLGYGCWLVGKAIFAAAASGGQTGQMSSQSPDIARFGNSKFYVKKVACTGFWGPYTAAEIKTKLVSRELSNADAVVEATGQSHGQLKRLRDDEWTPLNKILATQSAT